MYISIKFDFGFDHSVCPDSLYLWTATCPNFTNHATLVLRLIIHVGRAINHLILYHHYLHLPIFPAIGACSHATCRMIKNDRISFSTSSSMNIQGRKFLQDGLVESAAVQRTIKRVFFGTTVKASTLVLE